MRPRIFIIGFLFIIFGNLALAQGSFNANFTFDGPIPAYDLQNNYSSTAHGIRGIQSNPAAIMKSATAEVALDLGFGFEMTPGQRTLNLTDKELEFDPDSPFSDIFLGGIYFTDNVTDTSTTEFKQRDFNAVFGYNRGGGMTDFGASVKFNDWLAVGVTRARPMNLDFDIRTNMPIIFKETVELRGKTWENFTVNADGTAAYTDPNPPNPSFSTGGNTLYSEFIYKENNVATDTQIALNEHISDSREIAITLGTNMAGINWGINFIPMSTTVSFNNVGLSATTSGSENIEFYIPNFDPGNPVSIQDWFNNNRYVDENGYNKYTILAPPDQKIYEASISGVYSASATRIDLGMLWEPTDWLSIGAALENSSGAELNFRGVGVISTIETYITTGEAPELEPGTGNITFDPFLDEPRPIEDAEKIYLPQSHTVSLPQIARVGFALKGPVLLAIDYERYLNELNFEDITVSELSFLRIGGEMGILFLPLSIWGESRWMLKPTITVPDQETADEINDFYSDYPVIPSEFHLGFSLKLWGSEYGIGFGENHLAPLDMYQWNLSELPRMTYWNAFWRSGAWEINYMAMADVLHNLSFNAGHAEIVEDGADGIEGVTGFELVWTYTLGITYRF